MEYFTIKFNLLTLVNEITNMKKCDTFAAIILMFISTYTNSFINESFIN